MSTTSEVEKLVDHLFRKEYGKIVSYLTTTFGVSNLEYMEDITQETLLEAYKNWSYHGVPPEPSRWIFRVAKNKAINFSIRERKKNNVHKTFLDGLNHGQYDEHYVEREIEDGMLRMMFACSSLALSASNKIVLILNILCGFTKKEIAHALLMEEEAVKKRLFRAKKEIREKDLKLNVPGEDGQNEALQSVLSCLYLLFNEGYNSSHPDQIIREDLCLEAIRLSKIVSNHFQQEKSPKALLALMYFHAARFKSRIDDQGAIVLIKDQNRNLWDKDLIALGTHYLYEASQGNELSIFHLEAAISSEHCYANSLNTTDWKRIYKLYKKLLEFKSNPLIELNIAIIRHKLGDTTEAIEHLEKVGKTYSRLLNYYLYHATLGEIHIQSNSPLVALTCFEKSLQLTSSKQEIDLLREKINKIKESL